jgi:hypothetical protein
VAGALTGETVSLAGGSATFATKDVGTAKTVTGTGFVLGGDDKGNYSLKSSTITAKADITPKELTGAFTAADKVYDGDTSATITDRSVAGALTGETVSLAGGSATFATKDVGTAKTVTGTGFVLGGDDKGNYSLKSSTITAKADITPKQLTGGFTAANKVYDGTTTASVATRSLPGVIGSDDVSLAVTGASFATKDVGTDKTVTADLALTGTDKANYGLSAATAAAKADITPKPLTGGFTAANKVYDGTTAASITARSLAGTVTGETVSLTGGSATFDTPAVGANKVVTGTGFVLDGADKGNYTLKSATLTTTANITYAPAGVCGGSAGHAILQPINADGTSVFKQGSTVPAKFRVCDAAGTSIGTAGVVKSFGQLVARVGTDSPVVTEDVLSTTPDTAFRWSATDQQWIFNINTKSLSANRTYTYRIVLADGTNIDFQFGLK